MAIAKKLMEELARRREEAYNAGGKAKLEARRQKGLMTARDRIEALFDAGSFMEFGMHVQHNCHNFGMEKKVLPTDGIVCEPSMAGRWRRSARISRSPAVRSAQTTPKKYATS